MGFFNLFSSHIETTKLPLQHKVQLPSAMFANLSQAQKFAMVTMLASLAVAPTNAERTTMAQKMMLTDAALMGVTQDSMLNYMQTHTRPNAQVIRTTTNTNVLEWLMYCGFSIIAVNQNEQACCSFFDWWQQLGYEPEEIDHIVEKVEVICNKKR